MQRRHALTRLGGGIALGASAILGACTVSPDRDHTDPGAPAEGTLPTPPRVAWVFGSGGPRGFVHVGVIKALHEIGVQPDVVVGASAGALVGTLCAAGLSGRDIETLALNVNALEMMRWNPFGTERFSGSALADWIRQTVGGRQLQQLPTPMVCAVQRLRDGAVLAFTRGDAGLAVQASSAIEGRFAPVRIRGERYADADLRMPLPVRLARSLGAQSVLAVDASAHEDRAPEGAERFRESDRHKRALTAPRRRAGRRVAAPRLWLLGQCVARVPRTCHPGGLRADAGTGAARRGPAPRSGLRKRALAGTRWHRGDQGGVGRTRRTGSRLCLVTSPRASPVARFTAQPCRKARRLALSFERPCAMLPVVVLVHGCAVDVGRCRPVPGEGGARKQRGVQARRLWPSCSPGA